MAQIYNLQQIVTMRGTKANVEALTGTLEEVVLAYATDTGEIGIYTNGGWVWKGATVAMDLDDLGDVVITGPTLNEILQYDGSNWVNTIAPETGAGEILVADGVTPPEMLTNEAEDDFLYEG